MSSTSDIINRDNMYNLHGACYTPVVFVDAKDCIMKDSTGKEYIDCLSGAAGTTFIGWNRTEVTEAVRKQLEFPHAFFGHINLSRVELAEKLVKITPKQLTKAWFACGGGEVNEAAVKAAIKSTGKKEVISLFPYLSILSRSDLTKLHLLKFVPGKSARAPKVHRKVSRRRCCPPATW